MNSDEVRARILEVAERQFRRMGYHKTSVADIASEFGMSRANIYRFFPSKDAINESVCSRLANAIAEIALTIAHTNAPALERLADILTAIHHHNKRILIKEKRIHDLMVATTQGNRLVIKAYTEQIESILERIIRDGNEAREFEVDDPQGQRVQSRRLSSPSSIRFSSSNVCNGGKIPKQDCTTR